MRTTRWTLLAIVLMLAGLLGACENVAAPTGSGGTSGTARAALQEAANDCQPLLAEAAQAETEEAMFAALRAFEECMDQGLADVPDIGEDPCIPLLEAMEQAGSEEELVALEQAFEECIEAQWGDEVGPPEGLPGDDPCAHLFGAFENAMSEQDFAAAWMAIEACISAHFEPGEPRDPDDPGDPGWDEPWEHEDPCAPLHEEAERCIAEHGELYGDPCAPLFEAVERAESDEERDEAFRALGECVYEQHIRWNETDGDPDAMPDGAPHDADPCRPIFEALDGCVMDHHGEDPDARPEEPCEEIIREAERAEEAGDYELAERLFREFERCIGAHERPEEPPCGCGDEGWWDDEPGCEGGGEGGWDPDDPGDEGDPCAPILEELENVEDPERAEMLFEEYERCVEGLGNEPHEGELPW